MRRAAFVAPGLIFLLTLAIYLSTMTQVHTFDALSYVLDVDRKTWRELFHPHHLAYGPVGILVREIGHVFGWHGSTRVPLQIINAIAGALGVALFFALVRQVARRSDIALCAALLMGASYAYWYYAVEVEVYTIAALFLVVCLWLLIQLLQTPVPRICVALGVVQGLAVLFHQTNILLCVPIAAAFCLARIIPQEATPGYAWLRRGWLAMMYALPLSIIVIGSYVLVGFGFGQLRSSQAFLQWMTAYASTGWWGGSIDQENWGDLALGLASTLAQPDGSGPGLLLVGLGILFARRHAYRFQRLTVCLILWLITYGSFFLWWEPDNIEFWIASLPPAILLLTLILASGGSSGYPGIWLTLAIGMTMLVVNGTTILARGFAPYDLQRQIAYTLAQYAGRDDLLLVPDGMQELYLPYYVERNNTYSLNQAMLMANGNWPAACGHMRQRIDTALFQGSAVFIDEAVLYPSSLYPNDTMTTLNRFGLTPEQVTACFTPYLADLEMIRLEGSLPRYYRLPAAPEIVAGAGWHFSRQRWGWQAENIQAEALGSNWSFVPETDIQLTSPWVHIDTDLYQAIEIRIAATTERRDAQIFFLDANRQVEERRSVRFLLEPGSGMMTYRLELQGQPGWFGQITGLRLDPVGVGDGGWIRLESVRLVSKTADGT